MAAWGAGADSGRFRKLWKLWNPMRGFEGAILRAARSAMNRSFAGAPSEDQIAHSSTTAVRGRIGHQPRDPPQSLRALLRRHARMNRQDRIDPDRASFILPIPYLVHTSDSILFISQVHTRLRLHRCPDGRQLNCSSLMQHINTWAHVRSHRGPADAMRGGHAAPALGGSTLSVGTSPRPQVPRPSCQSRCDQWRPGRVPGLCGCGGSRFFLPAIFARHAPGAQPI